MRNNVSFIFLLILFFCDCQYAHQKVDQLCECYLEFKIAKNAGLGHRYFELAIAILIATEIRCKFVYDYPVFDYNGAHGNYKEFESFLNIDIDEMRSSELPKIFHDKATWIKYPYNESDSKCGRLFLMQERSCPGGYIGFCVGYPFSYEVVSRILKEKFSRRKSHIDAGKLSQKIVSKNGVQQLRIAWHVRIGDLSLHHNDRDYYQNLFDSLLDSTNKLENFELDITFFYECPHCLSLADRSGYTFIPLLCTEKKVLCHYSGNNSAFETFVHMLSCNILITSGSSFVQVAAMMTDGLVLFSQNKDQGCEYCQSLNSFVKLQSDGKLSPLEKSKFYANLKLLFT